MAPAGVLRFGKVTGRIPAAERNTAAQQPVERCLFTAQVRSPDDLHAPWGVVQLMWPPYGEAPAQVAHLAIADMTYSWQPR